MSVRAVVVFIVPLVLVLVVSGLLGANVGPYELLLAVVIALVVTWASLRMARRT